MADVCLYITLFPALKTAVVKRLDKITLSLASSHLLRCGAYLAARHWIVLLLNTAVMIDYRDHSALADGNRLAGDL